MKCCDFIKYFCLDRDAKPERPWYDRNNLYRTVAILGAFIGLLAFVLFIMWGPQTYVIGLLTNKILGITDNDDGYLDICAAGIGGIMLLIAVLGGLAAVLYAIVFLGTGIGQCVNYCQQCCNDYEQIRNNEVTITV